jgi:RimJ/RimL family protein N-acetyltransferase
MPPEGAYPRPHARPDHCPASAYAWQDAFGEDLARLASDERVMQYIGNGQPWNREQARQRHQACLRHWEDHHFGWRAILDGPGNRGLAAC